MTKNRNRYLRTVAQIIVLVLFPCWIYAQNPVDPYLPDTNSPSAPTGYVYAWGDEFNYTGSPDTTLWAAEKGFIRGQELQYYQMKNATVADGRLLITAKKESVLNERYDPSSGDYRLNTQYSQYTSASIYGKEKRYFLFGRIEVRAKIDTASSNFPAIWTCGINKYWPHNGEIDMVEYYYAWMDGVYQPVLTANFAAGTNKQWDAKWNGNFTKLSYYTGKDANWVKKYHVWRMDWNADSIYLYVDDELRNSISIDKFRNTDGSITFHNPQFMMLNLAIKPPTGYPTTPTKFEVDYFRVYQKTLDLEKPTTVTGLKASNVGASSCILSWKEARDNKGIYRYDIYNNGIFDGSYIGSSTNNTFLVTGLEVNSKNSFIVLALDSVGNYSDNSTPLIVNTLATTTAIVLDTLTIVNCNSGKVLSPLNASTNENENVVQVSSTDSPTQQWILSDLGNGYCAIRNLGTELTMDIKSSSTIDGEYLVQKNYTGATSQQWQLISLGDFYAIVNRNSEKYLDINGGSLDDNAQTLQWSSTGGKNQQWQLILKQKITEIKDSAKVISSLTMETETSLDIESSIDGTLYYVLLSNTVPSPTNIQDFISPTLTLTHGSTTCLKNEAINLYFFDLMKNTNYVLYMIVENEYFDSNISSFKFTTLSGVGVKEESLNKTLQLFPNPATDKVNISYVVDKKSSVKSALFSSEGKKLLSFDNDVFESGKHTQTLDVSHLQNGIYFYQLHIGSKISTKKLIINH